MRFYNNTQGRLAYHDRTPALQSFGTTLTNVAPHAQTTRVTINGGTRLRLVSMVNLRMLVNTVATAAGLRQMKAIVTPNGGSAADVISINLYGNTVDLDRGGPVTWQQLLKGVDTLALVTSDVSTGGSMDYMVGIAATDFDA